MRYRGFKINYTKGKAKLYNRDSCRREMTSIVFCTVYPGDTTQKSHRLEDFFLMPGNDISDLSDASIAAGIRKYVDDQYADLASARDKIEKERSVVFLDKALGFISSAMLPYDMCELLKDQFGMTYMEMVRAGLPIVAMYDRDGCARIIADYLTDTGTEETMNGFFHMGYEEINSKFGVALPDDVEMLEKVLDLFDRSVVARVEVSDGFDIYFNRAYCPHMEDTKPVKVTPSSK